MNEKIKNPLMQDSEILAFLKSAILQKAERYDLLLKRRNECPEGKIDELLSSTLTETNIRLIFEGYEEDEEIKSVERDLAHMCYTLNNSKRDNKRITDWERAYEYATKSARIEDVVRCLTGEENFNRNIKCPFHDDNGPSLKVYVKNNFFVCFACSARGSPIDFVMKYKNCSFREAVLYISNIQ